MKLCQDVRLDMEIEKVGKKLKCWMGNYDGKNQLLICEYSKRAAAEKLGRGGLASLNDYCQEITPIGPAKDQIGVLFLRPYNNPNGTARRWENDEDGWVERLW